MNYVDLIRDYAHYRQLQLSVAAVSSLGPQSQLQHLQPPPPLPPPPQLQQRSTGGRDVVLTTWRNRRLMNRPMTTSNSSFVQGSSSFGADPKAQLATGSDERADSQTTVMPLKSDDARSSETAVAGAAQGGQPSSAVTVASVGNLGTPRLTASDPVSRSWMLRRSITGYPFPYRTWNGSETKTFDDVQKGITPTASLDSIDQVLEESCRDQVNLQVSVYQLYKWNDDLCMYTVTKSLREHP